MAEGTGTGDRQLTREERAHLDLAASRIELSSALTRQVEFSVKQLNKTPDEAAAWVRSDAGIQPEDQASDQVSWFELSHLTETDPERGERLWQRIKDDARLELARGVRSSRTVEPKVGGSPIHRARFAAIVQGLAASLQPRDGLEELLIHQMACAYELHLHWQECASDRAQQEEWEGDRDRRNAVRNMSAREKERYDYDHGWMPPRVGTAEAIDQAVTIADRYQRSFLRLMKAFRDNRRLFSTLVVTGGQVNVGEQQVNVARTEQGTG
jgi:hypothetical protein